MPREHTQGTPRAALGETVNSSQGANLENPGAPTPREVGEKKEKTIRISLYKIFHPPLSLIPFIQSL